MEVEVEVAMRYGVVVFSSAQVIRWRERFHEVHG